MLLDRTVLGASRIGLMVIDSPKSKLAGTPSYVITSCPGLLPWVTTKSLGISVAETTATALGSVLICPSPRSRFRVRVSPGCNWELDVGFWFVMPINTSLVWPTLPKSGARPTAGTIRTSGGALVVLANVWAGERPAPHMSNPLTARIFDTSQIRLVTNVRILFSEFYGARGGSRQRRAPASTHLSPIRSACVTRLLDFYRRNPPTSTCRMLKRAKFLLRSMRSLR